MLRKIRDEAMRVAQERYGVAGDQLRMFIHYPPSYCEYAAIIDRCMADRRRQTTFTFTLCQSTTRDSKVLKWDELTCSRTSSLL